MFRRARIQGYKLSDRQLRGHLQEQELGRGHAEAAPTMKSVIGEADCPFMMGHSLGGSSFAAVENKYVNRLFVFKTDPALARDFFTEKLRSQWNEPSYGSIWINQVFPSYSEKGLMYDLLCGSGAKRTLDVMNVYQQFVFFSLLLGLIRLAKKKDLLRCLPPLVMLGGLLYHLLFEAKSLYAQPYFVLILPIAAYGLFTLYRKVELR